MEIENGKMKKEINQIINNNSIQDIEAALIKFFINCNNIKVKNNSLILNHLKNDQDALAKNFLKF